tara:strand:- start:13 stop:444 length:432 start_codon:yes stop_codon:yes gene_type:complete
MIFSFILIIILVALDIIAYNVMKKYVNKWYKKSIDLINKVNPLTKLELEESKNVFVMRMLVLSLFWLCIDLFGKTFYDLKRITADTDIYYFFEVFEQYYYTIFIIIGYFVYFALNIYCKTNSYLRTYDIVVSTLPTIFVVFMS